MTKHYHVLGGLHGCLPNVNEVYTTKADAQQGLLWHKRDEIEMSYQVEDRSRFSVYGTMRGCYYEVYNGGNDYYSIVPCQESDCLIDLDV